MPSAGVLEALAMSDVIALLRELVAIDSTSTKSNVPIIDALDRRLTAMGLTTQRQRYVDDAGVEKQNLLATTAPGLPELALVGHSDCVPFDPAWSEALSLTERGDFLYGRGSCDTKAFIACAVTAMGRAKSKLTKPAMLVFTADEELGCVGAKKLVEGGLGKTKRALIGEPTSLRPIRANKGYCLAEVEVHGKEGHSAYPDTGASAVFRAARLLTRLEAFSLGALRETTDAAFVPPFATLNVGLLSGGKAKNVIPGATRFTLEWRPLPGQDVNVVLDGLERLRRECIAEDASFSMTVKPLRLDRGFATDPSDALVTFISSQTGRPSDTVAFGTEGPQLVALGAVPVVFGPGDITVAHQTGEHVPTKELLRCADVMEAALLHFAG
jgi:acetylornithine deacetylase